MDTDSQARGGRAGRPVGAPNYKNDILIEIVERYLPQGLEAWNAVALQYQRESNELNLRRGEDLRENWNKKLCNRMQKPTGKPGANTDRIFRALRLSVAFRMKPPRPFWVLIRRSLLTLVTMAIAFCRTLHWRMMLGLVVTRRMTRWWLLMPRVITRMKRRLFVLVPSQCLNS